MRIRFWILLAGITCLGWLFFHRSPKTTYFPPFEETHLQGHHSSLDLIHFFERIKKKRWRTLIRLYKKHLQGTKKRQRNTRIPKILHQIALEKAPSAKTLANWRALHPDWEYILWTEEKFDALYPYNKRSFEKPLSLEEKTERIAFEILFQFGGVYVGSTCKCTRPLDILTEHLDFFAGAAPEIHDPVLNSKIIGTTKAHPILKACLKSESAGLTEAFFQTIHKKNRHANAILPSSFFYPTTEKAHPISFSCLD